MRLTKLVFGLVAAGLMVMTGVTQGLADTTVVVTPANQQGWTTADTRPGGTVTFVADPSSPYPAGALQLSTDLTLTAKAQYLHPTNTPLASVTKLSYWTKQVSPPGPIADPSYQLVMCLNGGTTAADCGFTTLVFEPYQNPQQGPIIPGLWQRWDVFAGLFWSTRTVTCSNGTVLGTPGGPATYTIAQIQSMCPSAYVFQFGVNIGSNNPGYVVRTDGFNFNGTIYDFQLTNSPASKEDCKDGGFANFTDAEGHPFKNQGQCVASAAHGSGDGEQQD